jgi:hypothetical protein
MANHEESEDRLMPEIEIEDEELALDDVREGFKKAVETESSGGSELDFKEANFFIGQLDALPHLEMTKQELKPLEDFYLSEARKQLAEMKDPEAIALLRQKIEDYETKRRLH